MMEIGHPWNWFAGNGRYMTLVHCMGHDTFWIALTVLLDLVIAAGYVLIALHWRRNEAMLPHNPAKVALRNMKNIFVFCGLCGYVFIPIKMMWPAWRLYDVFLMVLAYYTWRYALGTRSLSVVYQELGRTAKLAEDLAQSREEARRKSYFLNAISHDLKTPLNGMMLQIELASLNEDMDPGLAEALGEIKACAQTTANLLERFLEIGRLDWAEEPSRFEPVEMGELIERIGSQARIQAEQKGLELECVHPAEMTLVIDRMKLERVLFNLVDNAIKFTKSGKVRVLAERDDAGFRVSVDDTGEGISPENQALIFEEFVQVHNRERDSRKGFGLGLAIAKRLVGQIGGELSVESELGRGSCFTIQFPASVRQERVVDGQAGRSAYFVGDSAALARGRG